MSPAGLGPMNARLGESPYLALSGNPQSLAGGPMTARGTPGRDCARDCRYPSLRCEDAGSSGRPRDSKGDYERCVARCGGVDQA